MKNKIVTTVLLLIPFFINSHTVFILIHGTWALDENWYMPGGDFFDQLEKSVATYDTVIVPFLWSGKNNHHARIKAAHALVKLIESYAKNTIIGIIGHSHGGNVGVLASHMLTNKKSDICRITYFYALGTPVNVTCYYPNMDVITYFYNLFSFEDMVQPVFGSFTREYSMHPRIANITVTIDGKSPSHCQLHDPLIATWLPSLHTVLEKQTQPYPFSFGQPGIVHFCCGVSPRYEIDTQRKIRIKQDLQLTTMLILSLRSRKKIV